MVADPEERRMTRSASWEEYEEVLAPSGGLYRYRYVLSTERYSAQPVEDVSLTVNLRLRELMLPMLIYPMLVPALMAAMQLTTTLISGEPLAGEMIWLRLLIGFDIIFTALALALVETVLVG